MENIKVGDVFKLPMVCEQGDGYLYSKDLRYSIVFDDSDTSMMEQKTTVAIALNNHDRLVEENASIKKANTWHVNHTKELHEENADLIAVLSNAIAGWDYEEVAHHCGVDAEAASRVIELLNKEGKE